MDILEVRATAKKGRGVFATKPIEKGTCLVVCQGWLARSNQLEGDCLAMQVAPDLWLCSKGESLDDCINHSCEPNAGFVTGEPALFALRDIAPGEEIAWDYSTSIAERGWTLDCLCGSANCRAVIRSWWELREEDRVCLSSIALTYLRGIE